MISIDLYGDPVPQQRHRTARQGRIHYDPLSKIKEGTRWQIRSQFREEPIAGPVALVVTFFMPIPASTSKSRREEMKGRTYHHIKKPDIDNLQKFVFDCMNELVLVDDSQIVEVRCKKFYSENPGTNIKVFPVQMIRSNELPEEELNTKATRTGATILPMPA